MFNTSKGLAAASLILTLAFMAGCSSNPTPPPTSTSSPADASLPAPSPSLPVGWVELRETSPLTESSIHLLQVDAQKWTLTGDYKSGQKETTFEAEEASLPSSFNNGLTSGPPENIYGLALTTTIFDHNPERLRDNISTYLLAEKLTQMRASGESQANFELTPEMITSAVDLQNEAGLTDASPSLAVHVLDKLYEKKWPYIELTLNPSGEIAFLAISNGKIVNKIHWGK